MDEKLFEKILKIKPFKKLYFSRNVSVYLKKKQGYEPFPGPHLKTGKNYHIIINILQKNDGNQFSGCGGAAFERRVIFLTPFISKDTQPQPFDRLNKWLSNKSCRMMSVYSSRSLILKMRH